MILTVQKTSFSGDTPEDRAVVLNAPCKSVFIDTDGDYWIKLGACAWLLIITGAGDLSVHDEPSSWPLRPAGAKLVLG